MMPRQLVVMVKEPVAGRVKSRLAAGIGAVGAVAFYRHATAALVARVARPGEWRTLLAVTPDAAVTSRSWAPSLDRVGQGAGDLGDRMQRLMDRLPPGPVVVVGSDVPDIQALHIRHAFHLLGGAEAVFGPSPDGGYWLVGLRRRPRVPRAFAGVRWSSAHALADTLANLAGRRIAYLPTLSDVDTARDLAAAGGDHGRRVPGSRFSRPR